jgi:uncharacterized repeat protein (TIGR01451 family)
MPDVVADTHSLIWYLEDDPRLGPEADRTFEACDRGELLIYLPTICLVEIVYLQEKGRIPADSTVTLEATLWGSGAWANGTNWGGAGTVITGAVNLGGDPAFIDPDASDYHIRLASAAIDRGVNAGVDNDLDGQSRPQGSGYDVGADETGLVVTKQATPDRVQPGEPLTYTISVANTSDVDLHATITDTLPDHIVLGKTSGGTLVMPGGTVTWMAAITTPGGVWMETVVVTVSILSLIAGCSSTLPTLVPSLAPLSTVNEIQLTNHHAPADPDTYIYVP